MLSPPRIITLLPSFCLSDLSQLNLIGSLHCFSTTEETAIIDGMDPGRLVLVSIRVLSHPWIFLLIFYLSLLTPQNLLSLVSWTMLSRWFSYPHLATSPNASQALYLHLPCKHQDFVFNFLFFSCSALTQECSSCCKKQIPKPDALGEIEF